MTPVHQVAAAIASALVGVIASTLGSVLLLAQTTGTDTLAPYVSGGGAAAAVAGLVYIAKKLASGELVAVPIANVMRQQEEREKVVLRLLEEERERADVFKTFLVGRNLL